MAMAWTMPFFFVLAKPKIKKIMMTTQIIQPMGPLGYKQHKMLNIVVADLFILRLRL